MGYEWPSESRLVERFGSRRPNLRELWKHVGWLHLGLLERIPDRQSVRDTVLSGAFAQTLLTKSLSDGDEPELGNRLRRLIKRFGLESLAERRMANLSQGQQQAVLIARALMPRPDLLVLDEPTAGLDPGTRERFLTHLKRAIGEEGATLIHVTHRPEVILPDIKRVLLLKDGTILHHGPAEEVLTTENLEELYDLPELREHQVGGRRWYLPGE